MFRKRWTKIDKGHQIKILYLIGGLGMGGSERQLFLLLKKMEKTQFECHVLVLNPQQDDLRQSIEDLGVRVWDVPLKCTGVVRRMWFIYRLLLQIRPAILHSWAFYVNPYAGLAGWLAGVPVRLGSQRNAFNVPGVRKLPLPHRFFALFSVSKLVVNSRAAIREMITDNRRLASRLVYIPNLPDFDASFDNQNDEDDISDPGIGPGQRIVGIVGNLRRQKNHCMFLDAMAPLAEAYPDVLFVIVGGAVSDEPNVMAQIKSRIAELNLEGKVIMAGFRSNVPSILRQMSIVCLTSDYEGTPNVVIEAMLASRPVVATRVGDVPDLVKDGVSGFLVEPGDVPGFTQAVKRLLDAPELSKRMGQAGRQIVLVDFDSQSSTEKFTRLYRNSFFPGDL